MSTPQILFVLCERFECDEDHPDAEFQGHHLYCRYADSWTTCDSIEEAEELYEKAMKSESAYVANIVVCLKSTDYCTRPGHIDYTEDSNGYRMTLQQTHAAPPKQPENAQ